MQQRAAAGSAASALDEADMALRDAGVDRQVELALAAHAAPVAEQSAESVGRDAQLDWLDAHGVTSD